MGIKDLINKSYYGTIGYISSIKDIEVLEGYILYNIEVLKEYKQIIIATNYKNPSELIEENHNLWKKYFPNCILIDLPKNRGHNFGTADLDNALFDYCKDNNIEWLCKSTNDIILEKQILNLPLSEADFYYMSSIGLGGMVKYDFDNKRIINEDFSPQTNFYFINISKADYLNDKEYVDKTYNQVQNILDYNGKVWEYFPGWSCERFLKKCIERNSLSTHHLITPKTYIKLLDIILQEQIHDCSHKNIMIEGICHFHNTNQIITKI
tara:strand:- start:43 stop:840 length:798 start_codon:yes stop_codon:yes gene_type:complete